LGAAFWAVHPVNVESVAWITELKNVQSGALFLPALMTHLRFERTGRRVWYVAGLLCFAGALLSKPSTVVLPVALLLLAWWNRGAVTRSDVMRSVPFFCLAAGMSLLTIIEQRGHIERGVQDWSLNTHERFVIAGHALWFYAGKLLWPVALTFVYPRWETGALSILSLAPFVLAVVAGLIVWRSRTVPWVRAAGFGLGYFVITLLPVLGFFDIYYFRYTFVADHFQYLASAGVLALAAAGIALLRLNVLRVVLAAVALIVLTSLTWRHAQVFRDDETLWRDTLAKNPRAFIAHNNLGSILNGRKQYREAIACFTEALRLRPNLLEAHNNLGLAYTELGQYEQALEHLQTALRIKPDYSKSHFRLGVLYSRQQKLDEAAYEFMLAARHDPGFAEAYFEQGAIWDKRGDAPKAIACYRAAIAVRPKFALAHNNLATLLAAGGGTEEAIAHYRQAIAAGPALIEPRYNLALRLRDAGQNADAVAGFRRVIELDPQFAGAYLQLGLTLVQSHQYADAIATFRRGLEVEPRHMVIGNEMAWLMATAPDATVRNGAQAIQIGEQLVALTNHKEFKPLDTLAAAYAEAGRFDEAITSARKALSLAESSADTKAVSQIAQRLLLYERDQPYRSAGN
jgi:tetratricopeptide (TPR) repeat protein